MPSPDGPAASASSPDDALFPAEEQRSDDALVPAEAFVPAEAQRDNNELVPATMQRNDDALFPTADQRSDDEPISADEQRNDDAFRTTEVEQSDNVSTRDGSADTDVRSGGGRHSDGRPAETGLRPVRPKHLRDEAPAPATPPLDPRRAAERADSTVPMPVAETPRARRTQKAWLLAAAGVLIIVATTTFLLTDRRSGTPAPGAWAGTAPALGEATSDTSPATVTSAASGSPSSTGTPSPKPRPTITTTPPAGDVQNNAEAVVPAIPTTSAPTPSPTPTPATPAGPTPLPIVPFSGKRILASSGKCLDDTEASSSNNNPIQLFDCNGTDAQKFSFNADGTLRVIGKCIRPAGSGRGSRVQLFDCGSVPTAWQWYFRSDKVIVNKAYALCLTASDVIVNGAPQATIETCTGTSTQQWRVS